MYSQNNEEEIILKHFEGTQPKYMRFLDIGAANGFDCSNTRRLIELGWHGVMVEPAPHHFEILLNHYGQNAKLKLLNAALAPYDDFKLFSYTHDQVSTFDGDCFSHWKDKAGGGYAHYFVPRIMLVRFLLSFPGPYNFVSIDVNGTDAELLDAFPLDQVGDMLCIEWSGSMNRERSDKDLARIRKRMEDFKEVEINQENVIFCRP